MPTTAIRSRYCDYPLFIDGKQAERLGTGSKVAQPGTCRQRSGTPGLSSSKSYVLFTSALSPWFQANSCKNLHHSPKQKKHVLRGPVRAARMSMGCCAEQPPRDPGSHGSVQPCSQMQRVPTVVPRCHFCGLVCPRHAGRTLTPPRSLGPPGNVAECLRRIQASLTRPVPPRATIYIIS